MKSGIKISKEVEDKVCEMYLKGEKYTYILKETNISGTSLYNILNRNNIKRQKKYVFQKDNLIKHCIYCHSPLTDKNWYPSDKGSGSCTCKTCRRIHFKEWKEKNIESYKKMLKDWGVKNRESENLRMRNSARENIIGTYDKNGNHIRIKCKKRSHTLICELCHKEVKRTCYHHWDDNNPEWGIWVCNPCHWFCEAIESGIHEEDYLKLKEKVESGEI